MPHLWYFGDTSFILLRYLLYSKKENNADDYLEITFTGKENIVDVKSKIDSISENASYTILKFKTNIENNFSTEEELENYSIDSLTDDADGIFELCIKDKTDEEKEILRKTYREALELLAKDENWCNILIIT